MALIGALGPFQFDTYLPALPQITAEFGTTTSLVQATVAASLFGMATGQIVTGPISDSKGRRRPMLIALVAFIIAALACTFAPNVYWLMISRFLLGLSSATAFVVVNAFIRDNAHGQEAAKLYATQATIQSMAPIVAPLVGGVLLTFGDWRIVFQFLVVGGAAILAMVWVNIPESLAIEKRHELHPMAILRSYKAVIKDHTFRTVSLAGGLHFAMVSGFLATAPYVMESTFKLTPTQFTYFFAAVTLGIFLTTQLNRRLLKRFKAISLMRFGMAYAGAAGLFLAYVSVSGIVALPLTIAAFGFAVSSMGFIMANGMSLVMHGHGARAGAAAGLVGFVMTLLGALAAPLPSMFFAATVSGLAGFMAIVMLSNSIITSLNLRRMAASQSA